MADTKILAVGEILRGDQILVTVESIVPDIIVVSFVNGVKSFQGALLDVNKRGLPCGINSPQPIMNRDDDKLATLAARSTYFQDKNSSTISSSSSSPNSDLRKTINAPKMKRACRPTVRLRPRQVLCNKCQSICNEQNENVGVGRKRKKCDGGSEEQENIKSIPASSISRRGERRSVIREQAEKNGINGNIVDMSSLIPKTSRLHSTDHHRNDNQNNQLERNIQLCWLRSEAAGKSRQSQESGEYSSSVSRQISTQSRQLNNNINNNSSGSGEGGMVESSKPMNDVTTSKKKTLAAADSTIKNTVRTSEMQRTSRKKRSVGSMEDLWDENIFEDIIKSTSATQVTPVIKILFGTHGEGTVLKIPSKVKKSLEGSHEGNENHDESTKHDEKFNGLLALDESLSSTETTTNSESTEPEIHVQKLPGKDVACAKAAKRALKKAKKEARRIMMSGSGGVSPVRSPLNASPRYNPTYDALSYRRRKHKVKHKKKHKDERKQHKSIQLEEDSEDKNTVELIPTPNEEQKIHQETCNIFPDGESYTAIKEQCLKQKLSISLKRLNANAYTRCDYPVSNASSGCKSPDISSEELSEPEQEQSLENNVDTSDDISHFSTSHPLAIRFATTPVAHCLTATGRRMDVGDIVWGKIHGFPWWPGKVLSISVSCKEDGTSGGAQAHVAWYGSSTCSLMSCDRLSPFLETFKARYNKKKRGPYKEAIRQAQSEAQTQMSVESVNENVASVCESSREVNVIS